MVKKKAKSSKKSKTRKKLKKEIPQVVLALMQKVKGQLNALSKPLWVRSCQEKPPTVLEYKKMDPYWLSTMGGRFAGRVLGERR